MRKLTFEGYLKQYIQELSVCASYCLKKVDKEADSNYRVVAPAVLLAKLTGAKTASLQSERLKKAFEACANVGDVEAALEENKLGEEYQKVYKSFLSASNQKENENHTKALMLARIRKCQKEKHITNYRIYTDLHLNHGNINDFLTNGNVSKLSLATAQKILDYVS